MFGSIGSSSSSSIFSYFRWNNQGYDVRVRLFTTSCDIVINFTNSLNCRSSTLRVYVASISNLLIFNKIEAGSTFPLSFSCWLSKSIGKVLVTLFLSCVSVHIASRMFILVGDSFSKSFRYLHTTSCSEYNLSQFLIITWSKDCNF